MPSRERKAEYFEKMKGLLAQHDKILVVHADHVGSKLFADVRRGLRGKATVLMGKNTMMRKVVSDEIGDDESHPLKSLLPLLKGNVGLIFVNAEGPESSLGACKDVINEYTVPAPARAGVVANCQVIAPGGPTGCDPSMTNYFQALDIPTKIVKGQIEIQRDVLLVGPGEKVLAGHADLLQKLNIKPFTYGLKIHHVYNGGNVFDPAVLSITEDNIKFAFASGASKVAAVSLELNIPTAASIPHSLANAFKLCLSVCVVDGATFCFEEAQKCKDFLANPGAFGGSSSGGGDAKKEEEVVEEVEEEADADDVVVNFGGDDAW